MSIFDRNRIKESIDNLPSGVCFFDALGNLVLCNQTMYRLSFKLLGRDLQRLDEFQARLEQPVNAERAGENYMLDDGTVWKIAEFDVRDEMSNAYTQYVASDVTKIVEKQENLDESNRELEKMNVRLKALLADVNRIVREEETLAVKMRIHDELGHNMLAARKLLFENASAKRIRDNCDGWKMTIDYLNHIHHMEEGEVKKEELAAYAGSVGVHLQLEGKLPADSRYRALYVSAIKECVTNCVRHAKGSRVYAEIREDDLIVTNDGTPPADEIVESGGLGSLRERAGELQYDMRVESKPEFRLTLTPKAERDI